jgi:hypothetical protein
VIDGRGALLLPDVLADESLRGRPSLRTSAIGSALCAPLWLWGNADAAPGVRGLAYLDSRRGGVQLGALDLELLTVLANVAASRLGATPPPEEPALAIALPGYDVGVASRPGREGGRVECAVAFTEGVLHLSLRGPETSFVGRLDPGRGKLAYVNAAHIPPLVVRASGGIESLTGSGRGPQGVVTVAPKDTLLVFSEGVATPWPGPGEAEDALEEITRRANGRGARAVVDAAFTAIDGLTAPRALGDRSLIVVRRT